MMRPLQNRVVVQFDETIPTAIPGFVIPIKTDNWRGKEGAIESFNRGTVIAVGPGKRHPKTGRHEQMHFNDGECTRALQAGDVIRFSELQYPEFREDGKRYALITDGDVVGVEA